MISSLFQTIIDSEFKKLVGKVCKRIELLDIKEGDSQEIIDTKTNLMKQNIKEVLYEFCRDFRDRIQTGETKIIFEIEQSKEK